MCPGQKHCSRRLCNGGRFTPCFPSRVYHRTQWRRKPRPLCGHTNCPWRQSPGFEPASRCARIVACGQSGGKEAGGVRCGITGAAIGIVIEIDVNIDLFTISLLKEPRKCYCFYCHTCVFINSIGNVFMKMRPIKISYK